MKPETAHWARRAGLAAVVVGLTMALLAAHWFGYRTRLDASVPPPQSIAVKAAAIDGSWHFKYPNGQVSKGRLVVPIGRTIRLSLSSALGTRGFYLPELRVHRLVFPGSFTEVAFTAPRGRFRVRCGGYCVAARVQGRGSQAPREEIVVVEQAEYAEWLSALGAERAVAVVLLGEGRRR